VPPERKSQPRNLELAALGEAIEQRMTEKGLNQRSLADASKIDIRRVGDYIRGQHNPNLANLRKLCKGLELTVEQLIDRAAKLEDELSRT
jgi:transcriptional regulator with XRE-family HTH domain